MASPHSALAIAGEFSNATRAMQIDAGRNYTIWYGNFNPNPRCFADQARASIPTGSVRLPIPLPRFPRVITLPMITLPDSLANIATFSGDDMPNPTGAWFLVAWHSASRTWVAAQPPSYARLPGHQPGALKRVCQARCDMPHQTPRQRPGPGVGHRLLGTPQRRRQPNTSPSYLSPRMVPLRLSLSFS